MEWTWLELSSGVQINAHYRAHTSYVSVPHLRSKEILSKVERELNIEVFFFSEGCSIAFWAA